VRAPANCGSGTRPQVIRILLVEPMRLLRDALSAVLSAEDDLEVVAELDELNDVSAATRPVPPDLVVLGLEPAAPDGPDLLRRLREHLPDCRILVLTGLEGARALGSRMLGDLVHGLIDKDTTPSQLVRFIRDVAAGQRVVDPRLLPSLTPPDNPLTGREREVLGLAALGLPAGEIAVNLNVSTGTVRTYLSTIMRKTGARTLVEAARVAKRFGWL
jgi:two-component system, NarL family, response regulator DesR